jgi:hypothetical protein
MAVEHRQEDGMMGEEIMIFFFSAKKKKRGEVSKIHTFRSLIFKATHHKMFPTS